HVARPYVAGLFGHNLEIVSLVTRVRVRAPHVHGDAAAAQAGAREAQINRIRGRDDADAFRPPLENRVARQERVKLCERGWEVVYELLAAPVEARGQVHHQTTDAEVGGRQAPARRGLDQIQNLLALAEAVEEDGHRADVERMRA